METRATTREQIIQAAYRVLTEQGYDAATIKEIAREAGVAPGLLHYYFSNKDELLVDVLKDISTRYSESMQQLTTSLPSDTLQSAGLNVALQRTLQTPESYRLRYELFALALRNPALLPAIRDLLAGGRAGISHVVRSVVGDRSLDDTALAGILLVCFDGLALQHLVDPGFDIESAYRLLSQMLAAFLEPG